MPVKEFPKQTLLNLVWDDQDPKEYTVLSREIDGTSRWSINHYMVFKDHSDGKIYGAYYSTGATEQQDESPFQYDGANIKCEELVAIEVTKIEYKIKE